MSSSSIADIAVGAGRAARTHTCFSALFTMPMHVTVAAHVDQYGSGAELMLGTTPTCHCSRYFSVNSGVNHSGTRPSNGKNTEGFSVEPSLRSGPAEYDVEL